MSVQFTPKFFSRPSATAKPVAAFATNVTVHDPSNLPEWKKYSLNHPAPKHTLGNPSNPQKPSLTNDGQRYADVDWANHKVMTEDGKWFKFGSRTHLNDDDSE